MPKITPFLWFDKEAEQAANLYVSIFPNSKVTSVNRYPTDGPGGAKAGDVMTVAFELDGQQFTGINGGDYFTLSEAVSFVIDCKDQAEVDHYWEKLTADGGKESQCGWLKDRFGLSWQVTPRRLIELTTGPDKAENQRVFAAMMQMSKIDIAKLEAAAAG